jgi:hypothetical protein
LQVCDAGEFEDIAKDLLEPRFWTASPKITQVSGNIGLKSKFLKVRCQAI